MSRLVFWHGWGMAPEAWHPLLSALDMRFAGQFTAQTPALPGYMGTPLPGTDACPAWVDTLMAPLSEPVVLCGWSMGAIMALDAARRYPGKIRKLVLFGATPCFINRHGWANGLPEETAGKFREGVQTDSRTTLRRFIMLFNQHDQHAREISRQLASLPYPSDEVLLKGLDFLHTVDFRTIVPEIQQPVLLVHGRNDPLMPVSTAEWLAKTLPDASLTVIPKAAHAPFLSVPGQCADIIGKFLRWS